MSTDLHWIGKAGRRSLRAMRDQIFAERRKRRRTFQLVLQLRKTSGEIRLNLLVEGVLFVQILKKDRTSERRFFTGELIRFTGIVITSDTSRLFTFTTDLFQFSTTIVEVRQRQTIGTGLKSIPHRSLSSRLVSSGRERTFSDWCQLFLVCVELCRNCLSVRLDFDECSTRREMSRVTKSIVILSDLFISGHFDQFLHLFGRFFSFRFDEFVDLDQVIDGLIQDRRRAIVSRHFTLTKVAQRFTQFSFDALVHLKRDNTPSFSFSFSSSTSLTRSFSFFQTSENTLQLSRMYRTRL